MKGSNSQNSLEFDKAFDAFKFYENAASTIKGRTWTITAWILTVNSGLFGFIFSLLIEISEKQPDFLLIVAAYVAGLALCWFLFILVLDQGGHLQWCWALQEKAKKSNSKLRELTLTQTPTEEEKKKQENRDKTNNKGNRISLILYNVSCNQKETQDRTGKPFPKFCGKIIVLTLLYAVGFTSILIYSWCRID